MASARQSMQCMHLAWYASAAPCTHSPKPCAYVPTSGSTRASYFNSTHRSCTHHPLNHSKNFDHRLSSQVICPTIHYQVTYCMCSQLVTVALAAAAGLNAKASAAPDQAMGNIHSCACCGCRAECDGNQIWRWGTVIDACVAATGLSARASSAPDQVEEPCGGPSSSWRGASVQCAAWTATPWSPASGGNHTAPFSGFFRLSNV